MSPRLVVAATVVLSSVLAGCVPGGVRHGWIMRGQVLALDDDVATVCIGTEDGAKVGQVLDVHHIVIKPGPPKQGQTVVRTDAGKVEIVDLFDGHYAHAKVRAGSPALNDVVELQMK